MRAEDVTDTLALALAESGCDSATVLHEPGSGRTTAPSYIAGELPEYIEANKMGHLRGARVTRRPRARSSAGTRQTGLSSDKAVPAGCIPLKSSCQRSNSRRPPSVSH